MTDQLDLTPIRQRLDAATPGPWNINRYQHGGGRILIDDALQPGRQRDLVADAYDEGTREFLYNTPTDIAALLTEVERLRAAVQRVREVHLEYYEDYLEETCCTSCSGDSHWSPWPCPTILALDGGESDD